MAVSRYFAEQVLRKRPYLSEELCRSVLADPIRQTIQGDGRTRLWGAVNDPRDGRARILRVIVLEDGQTIHNAFFDRDFEANPP